MAFTYFFRDRLTLELIVRHILPVLKGHRYINIWDAGCAHGPEAYSLAIILRENMSHFLFRNVHLYATDIDTCDQFGRIIVEGVYPEEELKRMPVAIRSKYFSPAETPGCYRVADEIRKRISFVRHDLLSLEPVRTGFNLVVCKNVLLHFKEEERNAVIRMFHAALRQGGFLVTEQTQKLPRAVSGLFKQLTAEAQILRKVESVVSDDVSGLEVLVRQNC